MMKIHTWFWVLHKPKPNDLEMLPLLIHNFLMPILHLFRMQISLYISSPVICSRSVRAKLYMTDQKLSQVCKSKAEGGKQSLRKRLRWNYITAFLYWWSVGCWQVCRAYQWMKVSIPKQCSGYEAEISAPKTLPLVLKAAFGLDLPHLSVGAIWGGFPAGISQTSTSCGEENMTSFRFNSSWVISLGYSCLCFFMHFTLFKQSKEVIVPALHGGINSQAWI